MIDVYEIDRAIACCQTGMESLRQTVAKIATRICVPGSAAREMRHEIAVSHYLEHGVSPIRVREIAAYSANTLISYNIDEIPIWFEWIDRTAAETSNLQKPGIDWSSLDTADKIETILQLTRRELREHYLMLVGDDAPVLKNPVGEFLRMLKDEPQNIAHWLDEGHSSKIFEYGWSPTQLIFVTNRLKGASRVQKAAVGQFLLNGWRRVE